MNRITVLLALFAISLGTARAVPPPTNSPVNDRVLMIDSSCMKIGTSKATLTIGLLRRTAGVYTGDYKIKVFPYFFKNEKGRLAIVVSDASLAEISRGKVADITGTATTSGKGGQTRPIGATATPADPDKGTLKLWFMAGDRKMIFAPAYHFAGGKTMVVLASPAETNPTSNSKGHLPALPRQTPEIAALYP